MQQFFDPQQQANMNGYSGASGFQSNQQNTNSFNGPSATNNPYMNNTNFRQQNGISRFGAGNESTENFEGMQSPPTNQSLQQGFQNFVDPRISNFDPRNRPNFDPMSSGMHAFLGNSNNPSKMRVNDMAALFNNPAAMAAYQRQRMGMFGQGRENVGIISFYYNMA